MQLHGGEKERCWPSPPSSISTPLYSTHRRRRGRTPANRPTGDTWQHTLHMVQHRTVVRQQPQWHPAQFDAEGGDPCSNEQRDTYWWRFPIEPCAIGSHERRQPRVALRIVRRSRKQLLPGLSGSRKHLVERAAKRKVLRDPPKPRWTPQIRPLIDTAKPATRPARCDWVSVRWRPRRRSPAGVWSASCVGRK